MWLHWEILASSSKRYTRRNPDPDPKTPVEDPESILKEKKQSDQSDLPIFEISTSLASDSIKTLDGLKFDLKFEQSLFRTKSKSYLDLSEVVIDILGLNTFVPKYFFGFSKKVTCIFWDSLSKWVEAELVPSCTKEIATKFNYENIITRFGCPLTLISDQGSHFINQTIQILLKEFLIDHHKSLAYHRQANGSIESFNKTLAKGLTKICNIDKDDWDEKIPAILWAYRTTYKKATNQTPFKLVYR